jgi:hypothetical protein
MTGVAPPAVCMQLLVAFLEEGGDKGLVGSCSPFYFCHDCCQYMAGVQRIQNGTFSA